MSARPPDEALSAAEARLVALLAILPAPGDADAGPAVRRTMLTLRWQRSLKAALQSIGWLAGSLGDAIGALLRSPR